MKAMYTLMTAGSLTGFLAFGCGGEDTLLTSEIPDRYSERSSFSPPAGQEGGETVYIEDRTGKRWDVGHAERYGLVWEGFQYGLGPTAIRPLNNPEMLFPGNEGYPDASDRRLGRTHVLGVDLNGFVRAYPTWSALARFEVVNEQFGDAHVAVAF